MTTGKLIVFEGPRGAGKSTCMRAVAARLRSFLSVPVVETREPTEDTVPGKLARRILRGEEVLSDLRAFQLLTAADRLEHVASLIGPALARGEVVLCDRYVLSSAAFAPMDVNPMWITHANTYAPSADLTIVIHVPPEEGMRRVLARDGKADALAATATRAWRFYAEDTGLAQAFAHSRRVAFISGMPPAVWVEEMALLHVLRTLGVESEGAS